MTTHNQSITHRRMSMIFNEWAKRYSENPSIFSNILDADGKPVSDYGDCCAIYFYELATEMDAANLLPRPDPAEVRFNCDVAGLLNEALVKLKSHKPIPTNLTKRIDAALSLLPNQSDQRQGAKETP